MHRRAGFGGGEDIDIFVEREPEGDAQVAVQISARLFALRDPALDRIARVGRGGGRIILGVQRLLVGEFAVQHVLSPGFVPPVTPPRGRHRRR